MNCYVVVPSILQSIKNKAFWQNVLALACGRGSMLRMALLASWAR